MPRAQRGAQTPAPHATEVRLEPDACRRRREALGLTPSELARRAGVLEITVMRYEAASVRPRPVTVVALRNALSRAEAERTPAVRPTRG